MFNLIRKFFNSGKSSDMVENTNVSFTLQKECQNDWIDCMFENQYNPYLPPGNYRCKIVSGDCFFYSLSFSVGASGVEWIMSENDAKVECDDIEA